MSDHPLPFELEAIATRLRRLSPGGSPAGMKGRVLDRVAVELEASRRLGWWRFAGAAAAAIVLWMNLSWVAARQTSFALLTSSNVEQRAACIEEMRLGISPEEARRLAVLTSLADHFGPDAPCRGDAKAL